MNVRPSPLPRTLEGHVRGLGHDGDAVVETSSGLVFAAGGLPTEHVRVEGITRDGKILRARHLQVLTPSPARVESPCAHAVRCGGCPWMHAAPALQQDTKRARVERALARIPRAGDEVAPIELVAPLASLGYRRRARLSWIRTGQGTVLGYRGRRTDTVVGVDRCVVLDPVLDAVLSVIRGSLVPLLPGTGELLLALGMNGRACLGIETPAPLTPALYEALVTLVDQGAIAGAMIRAAGATLPGVMGDPREWGQDIEGRALRGPAFGFSQAHGEMNARLGAAVIDAVPATSARVLELHAGHGNLTLALAARSERVRAVELSRPAAESLRENLDTHGLGAKVEVIIGDAASNIPDRGFDVVVLDPPRTGARPEMDAIRRLAPSRVVYVSCDPATLGRDLEPLAGAGYVLDHAVALDMFPQTAHVETVVRLTRRTHRQART